MTRLYAELIGICVFVAVAIGLWLHHDRVEQEKGAAVCQAKVTETKIQADAEAQGRYADYELQRREAQQAHDNALRHIPPTLTTPIIVRLPGAVCSNTPGLIPETGSMHSDTNGDGPGSGERDIRSGIEAFKVRYGASLLDCQQVLDSWPYLRKTK